MGWDIIEYDGEHEQFRDSDLWLLRHFLLRGVQSLAPSLLAADTNDLQRFFEGWQWLCPGVFTGTDFTGFVSGSRLRRELLFRALQSAADLIAEFGSVIPLSYLAPNCNEPGFQYTADLPTRPFLLCIGRICTMLSKHEPDGP